MRFSLYSKTFPEFPQAKILDNVAIFKYTNPWVKLKSDMLKGKPSTDFLELFSLFLFFLFGIFWKLITYFIHEYSHCSRPIDKKL